MTFVEVLKEIKESLFPTYEIIREDEMLNKLKSLFREDVSLVQTCKLSAMVINMLNEFNADMLKDGNTRDAAIDCIIELLQSEKSSKSGF